MIPVFWQVPCASGHFKLKNFRRVPKRGQNSEQDEKSLKKRKMPLQAFEFPEYVIPSCCSFPL